MQSAKIAARSCVSVPFLVLFALLTLLAGSAVPVGAEEPAAANGAGAAELPYELRQQLEAPLRDKLSQLAQSKNEDGVNNKRGTYSRNFVKVDEDTYEVAFHVDTADKGTLTTERLALTLERTGPKKWEIAEETVEDTYVGLHRSVGTRFRAFDAFEFDRGGLKLVARNGEMFEILYQGETSGFVVMADTLEYDYTAPEQQDYYQLQKFMEKDYQDLVEFKPRLFEVVCDPLSCKEIIETSFQGLVSESDVLEIGAAPPEKVGGPAAAEYDKRIKKTEKDRRENPFAHFRRPYQPGHHRWTAVVEKGDNHSIGVTYDNWDGYDLQFWIYADLPGVTLGGPVFGYYSDELLAEYEPYDLEQRPDAESRWYELYSLEGTIEAALTDPEMLHGDVTYGLRLLHDARELPFFIATIRRDESDTAFVNPTLFVNSVQYEGQELTWVKTGPFSGLIVLPEPMPAGTEIELRMDFASRVIYKVNHAFSAMARGGWLPFVRFGDMIDEFALTLKTPDKYDVLGIGKKVDERKEGDVLVTRWVAESPVVFPTIIFGKYVSDSPKIVAEKADGTEIPVRVYVDEVSMAQLAIDVQTFEKAEEFVDAFSSGARGIREKQLRAIGDQSVNAINLYRELTGLDYPYGELNLVNDPAPAMYGQAPSSLIYLGSFVFRGEGTMAGDTMLGGGGTNTAKFLKSVVAHEVAHQWWGSRIANANGRNYWFVESLAEYLSALWLEAVHGPKEYKEQVDEWRKRVLDIDQRVSVQNASVQWGGEFPGAAYQAAVYNKGPYFFHILRHTFGDEKFFPAFKKFCLELSARREVVTRDIQQTLEAAFGGVGADGQPYSVDLEWAFDQWIRGAGIPQYSVHYSTRRAEDGTWIVEGNVKQRVVVGNRSKFHVLPDTYYRGVVSITVVGKDKKEYPVRFAVEAQESTAFAFKVPVEPRDIVFNKNGEMLSLDPLIGRDF